MSDAKKIRSEFIKDIAPLVKDMVLLARGKGVVANMDEKARDQVWEVAKQIILQTGDTQELEARNIQDVLNLIAKGKVTPSEAKDLMQLVQSKFEMEEVASIQKMLSAFSQNRLN